MNSVKSSVLTSLAGALLAVCYRLLQHWRRVIFIKAKPSPCTSARPRERSTISGDAFSQPIWSSTFPATRT